MTAYVAYCRVSTEKQGKSGLGLEAQQAAIQGFLRPGDELIQPPYVEVESGKRSDRPKLLEAIERCRKTGATLLIAKLDRLSRDAHFLLGLQKAGVRFVAADMPSANELMVGMMALFAQEERRLISERTKAALKAAKARGQKLGGDRGYRPSSPPDHTKATEVRTLKADHAAHAILPVIRRVQQEVGSLNATAIRLNEMGHATPRGGAWTATAVKRALARTEG
ncbi:resolvase [Microvirga ossetica]|uniref:Resolvase n=1 Tax=Microvirga ossetica TaxID=1882682 RepID=A0A1B2EPC0_9HYPH|nr:recombinase family protein [Microvirga ossetica]ANY81811.1 resolvase [Microvirga ossetica]